LDGTTISIDDLRAGDTGDLLAEADVIIAVDASSNEEEVVYGRHEWELASETGHEEDLVVLRVELEMEEGDLEWLVETIENDGINNRDDDLGIDEDEDD
jgi:hypothetical protein